MHSFIMKVEKLFKNPWLEALLGLIIMATGLAEAGEQIFEDIGSGDVGAHHGIILLGFAHAIKAVPAILGGMTIFAHGAERESHH